VDSFEHYAGYNKLYGQLFLRFFPGKINGLELGIYSDTSRKVRAIFKINDVWRVADQVELPLFDLSNVDTADFNHDGLIDLRVDGFCDGIDESRSVVLLYDLDSLLLVIDPQFSYPSIAGDRESGCYHSDSWNYDTEKGEKRILVNGNGCLDLKEGVTFSPDTLTNGEKAKVEFF
jgi:hypothetical protein